jgi:hypothetical protein
MLKTIFHYLALIIGSSFILGLITVILTVVIKEWKDVFLLIGFVVGPICFAYTLNQVIKYLVNGDYI